MSESQRRRRAEPASPAGAAVSHVPDRRNPATSEGRGVSGMRRRRPSGGVRPQGSGMAVRKLGERERRTMAAWERFVAGDDDVTGVPSLILLS